MTQNQLDLFLEYWTRRLERDLASFADPGTEVEFAADGRAVEARWMSRAETLEARFLVSLDRGVRVLSGGSEYSYSSFLSSPLLADLRGLAKMTLQSRSPTFFVPTKARPLEGSAMAPTAAVELIADLLQSDNPASVTRIIMITGEAGAGKTRVLQELTRRQAQAYVRGLSECLFVYINAQGRALARFNEALATELQDLRARVTYHAIPALVRAGILVPIIDGFDELLGVSGYDDAFSSLTTFIEELDGEGQVLASARSTYYQQEFVSRASSISSLGSQAWTQVPVEILAWDQSEFDTFLRLKIDEQHLEPSVALQLRARVSEVFSDSNAHLRAKPLFVARTVDAVLSDPGFSGGVDLLPTLVQSYLERERKEKLIDRHGGSLLASDQIRLLLETLAEEMWNQETRELDRRSVREVAEYVLVTQELPENTQRVVMERMPQMAFLMPGEKSGGIAFEHEIFFSFFLAQVFARKLVSNVGTTAMLLSRSVLPPDVAVVAFDQMVISAGRDRDEVLVELLDVLSRAASIQSPRNVQIRENAGRTALAAIAGTGKVSGCSLSNLVFPGGSFGPTYMSEVSFSNVEMRRVDLSRTRIVKSGGQSVLFSECIVDPEVTRIEIRGIDPRAAFVGLSIRGADGSQRTEFDPEEIEDTLIRIGAQPGRGEAGRDVLSVDPETLAVLDRLVRAYMRSNPICLSDDNLRSLFRHSRWPAVEEALLRHGLITEEHRATGGRPKRFLRRQFLPEQLLAARDLGADASSALRTFWLELAKEGTE